MSAVNNDNCLPQWASQVLGPELRTNVTQLLSNISWLATFIIGCIGAAGVLPGSTMGWLAIGLGGGSFLFQLAGGKLKERKVALLILATLTLLSIILGALGVAGVLAGTQLGWGLVAIPLIVTGIGCGVACCITATVVIGINQQTS